MWKSLVTGKVLSPNVILFKVALDPNSLFLAIKLHFFLSVTVFFSFFFFFLLEKDLSWVLCKQMLRLGIQGKSWFMGKSLLWYSIGKRERPFRLVPNELTGQPLVPASVSQRLGATSGWGRFPASQPKAFQASRELCSITDNPSSRALMPLDWRGYLVVHHDTRPPSLPPSASRVKSEAWAALLCENIGLLLEDVQGSPQWKIRETNLEGPLCYTFRGSREVFSAKLSPHYTLFVFVF